MWIRYDHKGLFQMHYDWLPETVPSMNISGNRESSFFVYLLANCDGGTTVFPGISRPSPNEWCDALKCRDDSGEEVKWVEVKPAVGRAIFWYNLNAKGEVDGKTLHAGAPVYNGRKIGMNIWTRERSWRNRLLH